MNKTETELSVGYRRKDVASIKGERTRHVVTSNPNSAKPGQSLYVNVPNLKVDSCLVPGSLHLLFDFKVSGVKTTFLNNLSSLLQKQVSDKIGWKNSL